MTDDLLDAAKDRAECKLTYVTLYGEAETKRFIEDASQRALSILNPYRGESAKRLRTLILKLRNRTE